MFSSRRLTEEYRGKCEIMNQPMRMARVVGQVLAKSGAPAAGIAVDVVLIKTGAEAATLGRAVCDPNGAFVVSISFPANAEGSLLVAAGRDALDLTKSDRAGARASFSLPDEVTKIIGPLSLFVDTVPLT